MTNCRRTAILRLPEIHLDADDAPLADPVARLFSKRKDILGVGIVIAITPDDTVVRSRPDFFIRSSDGVCPVSPNDILSDPDMLDLSGRLTFHDNVSALVAATLTALDIDPGQGGTVTALWTRSGLVVFRPGLARETEIDISILGIQDLGENPEDLALALTVRLKNRTGHQSLATRIHAGQGLRDCHDILSCSFPLLMEHIQFEGMEHTRRAVA